MEIHVDVNDPNGTRLMIGPFVVERKDYGMVVKQVGRGKKYRFIVYREFFEVKAYGKFYTGHAEVDQNEADLHKGGPAAARMEAAMKVLKRMRAKIMLNTWRP